MIIVCVENWGSQVASTLKGSRLVNDWNKVRAGFGIWMSHCWHGDEGQFNPYCCFLWIVHAFFKAWYRHLTADQILMVPMFYHFSEPRTQLVARTQPPGCNGRHTFETLTAHPRIFAYYTPASPAYNFQCTAPRSFH